MIPEEIKNHLSYDSDEGVFIWHNPRSKKIKSGTIAGSTDSYGYRQIEFNGVSYLAHRLAWWYVHGVWPKELHHIDEDRQNNRIENLKEVTHRENVQYQNRFNRGTYFHKKRKKWCARISIEGKRKHLGYFNEEYEAQAAYVDEWWRIRF